jgi:NAD(P)-dependent dehydrogenase (short-subunit alcohol dehydrogenase family)
MLLDGKVAVVTGSGIGIGRAHAIALAQAGARVVVNSRTASDVESVVDKIRRDGGRAEGCVASVAHIDGAQRIIQTAIDRFGRIDILVNNAGINRR